MKKNKTQKDLIIIGTDGLIGQTCLAFFARSTIYFNIIELTHDEIYKKSSSELRTYFRKFKNLDIIVATGLTNANLDEKELLRANNELPRKVLQSAPPYSRVVTFGTIHEKFEELCKKNKYFASKRALADFFSKFLTNNDNVTWLHLRLHTVYGGVPKPHMFLGQIAHALLSKTAFQMSSGEQLREYLYVEDLAASISSILQHQKGAGEIIEINTAEPIRLRDLATSIFSYFKMEHLLTIGAIPTQQGENFQVHFPRTKEDYLPSFVSPIKGVCDYLKHYLRSQPLHDLPLPLVTVVIPAYSGEDFIAEAKRSLLAQTYKNIEILILDTANIQQEAKGEFIKLLCHDDLIGPNCIEKEVGVLLKDPTVVLTACSRKMINAKGVCLPISRSFSKTRKFNKRELLHAIFKHARNPIGKPSLALIRKSAADKAGLFDGAISSVVELDYWMRLLHFGDFYYIDEKLVSDRLTKASWSKALSIDGQAQFAESLTKLQNEFPNIISKETLHTALKKSWASRKLKTLLFKFVRLF